MKKYVVLLAVVLFLVAMCAWADNRSENMKNDAVNVSENAYVHEARDGGGGGRNRDGDGGDGEYGPNGPSNDPNNDITSRDITSNDNSIRRSDGGGCNSSSQNVIIAFGLILIAYVWQKKNILKILCGLIMLSICVTCIPSQIHAANTSAVRLTNEKMWSVLRSLEGLANNIAKYHKHSFETKLFDRDMWRGGLKRPLHSWGKSRVWVIGKNIVTGVIVNGYDELKTYSLMTADPEKVFEGGIRVGADVSVLEKFFGAPLSKITFMPGIVHSFNASDFGFDTLCIYYRNGKITEIYGQWGSSVSETFVSLYTNKDFPDSPNASYSPETVQFIKRKRGTLGFPNNKFRW